MNCRCADKRSSYKSYDQIIIVTTTHWTILNAVVNIKHLDTILRLPLVRVDVTENRYMT